MLGKLKNALSGAGLSIEGYADQADIAGLIRRLHPVTTAKRLIRVGGDGDGGYLTPDDLDGIVAAFSPGVDVSSSFEMDLVARGVPCFLADASVEAPPVAHPLIHFERKFLGVVDDERTTTLDAWAARHAPPSGDLLLQMDIEGAEWPVLLNASDRLLDRFRIIVLEMHELPLMMGKVTYPIAAAAFDRLLRRFHVVHVHPNNSKAVVSVGRIELPKLIEITLLRKDRAEPTGYAHAFPHPLDRANWPSKADLTLPRNWYRSV